MSTSFYTVIAVNQGHEKFESGYPHDKALADHFLRQIGHTRHAYLSELPDGRAQHDLLKDLHRRYAKAWTSELVVCANSSGVVALSPSLALNMAAGSKKSERAARISSKLLACAYNDQCLVDVFRYYENGVLLRYVSERDGDERADVSMEGNLLPEEIKAVTNSQPHPEADADQLTEFVVNGTTYVVERWIPMRGCGLKVAERLGLGEEAWWWKPDKASVYVPKPWWKRW